MTKVCNGPWHIWLAPGSAREPILAAVDSYDRGAGEAGETAISELWRIHPGGRSTVYGARQASGKACLKVFTDQSGLAGMRTFFGWSKGRRAYRNGLLAFDKGVPVPRVYAYAEKRPFGPTLVVMELLENAMQMNLLLEQRLAGGIDLLADAAFHELTVIFAKFTRDLHDHGVCHRDFSPRNVLVAGLDGQPRLQLIDLEDIDFVCSARRFRSDIEHFHSKMSRYVNPAVLLAFRNSFNEIYGKELSR